MRDIAIVRRLREINAEDSLYDDWKGLARWLKVELHRLAPALQNWASPWVEIARDRETGEEYVSVNIEPDSSWTFAQGKPAVCLGFYIFPQSAFDDDIYAPTSLFG